MGDNLSQARRVSCGTKEGGLVWLNRGLGLGVDLVRGVLVGDDSGAWSVREVGKAPIEQHAELVAEADQKNQMHPQPS